MCCLEFKCCWVSSEQVVNSKRGLRLPHTDPSVCLTEWVHKRQRNCEWNEERQRERTARAQPLMWSQSGRGFRLAVAWRVRPRRCWTLTGADCWAPSLYSLMIVPQHPVPRGGKHFFKEEGSPRALLSLKLAANNPSNLVTSSATHNPLPPRSTSPGSKCPGRSEQVSEEQSLCSQFILPMFFPACHGSLCTFPALEENLVAHCCFLVAQERVWPHMTSQGDRCWMYGSTTRCSEGCIKL